MPRRQPCHQEHPERRACERTGRAVMRLATPLPGYRGLRGGSRAGLLGWLVLLATLAACGEAFAGTIVTRELESKTLGRTWSYNVYLPTGYEGSTGRYP